MSFEAPNKIFPSKKWNWKVQKSLWNLLQPIPKRPPRNADCSKNEYQKGLLSFIFADLKRCPYLVQQHTIISMNTFT